MHVSSSSTTSRPSTSTDSHLIGDLLHLEDSNKDDDETPVDNHDDRKTNTRSKKKLFRLDSGIREMHESLYDPSLDVENTSGVGQSTSTGSGSAALVVDDQSSALKKGQGGIGRGRECGHVVRDGSHQRKPTSDFDSLLMQSVSTLKIASAVHDLVQDDNDVIKLFNDHAAYVILGALK